jgi:DNA mismatch endonuclease (patch repair protein)
MSRVRRSGTKPELALRTALRRARVRYRPVSGSKLPGSPDFVFRQARLAVFVDGCFWHGCPKHGTTPKTNTFFWLTKILRNRRRDRRADRLLKSLGWRVLRLWEHETRCDIDRAARQIKALVKIRTDT